MYPNKDTTQSLVTGETGDLINQVMASLLLGSAGGRLVGAARSAALEWLALLWLVPLLASSLLLRTAAPLLHAAERLLNALGWADHVWMAIGLAARPFFPRTPGYFERRCVARALGLQPPHYAIEVRRVATATVNEGKDVLRATLWLPKGAPGPFPTLILRSPYGAQDKDSEWGQMILAERGWAPHPLLTCIPRRPCPLTTPRGSLSRSLARPLRPRRYAVLFQDTRGRFGSDGDFVPVEHEKADGAATVRWVRAQSWCDGRVGVIGPSYLGFAAWACVGACEPGELQAAIPTITQAYAPAVRRYATRHSHHRHRHAATATPRVLTGPCEWCVLV